MKAAIFGGTGFIGVYFARYLIDECSATRVYLLDTQSLREKNIQIRLDLLEGYHQIEFVKCDVRVPITWTPDEPIDLIANFAAVHREPGHKHFEYYECNVPGAQHVCDLAERINCERLIFSSSIAPYGPCEDVTDESAIPSPTSAYGGSKLVAEKMHLVWHAKTDNRRLVIVRPGVVFGPGEGGNVSRLIKAVTRRYFFYCGNKDTRKAGIYVKELCNAMVWTLALTDSLEERFCLVNMTMDPGPSVEEYVDAICQVAGIRPLIPAVPSSLLYSAAWLIDLILKPLPINHPFSPVRIKKLINSNNVVPNFLKEHNYVFRYTLNEALNDWRKENPVDW